MGSSTALIVPATVPDALLVRLPYREPARPAVVRVAPASVPVARAMRIVPDQLTAEQVRVLREENAALREELARVRAC